MTRSRKDLFSGLPSAMSLEADTGALELFGSVWMKFSNRKTSKASASGAKSSWSRLSDQSQFKEEPP